MPTSVGPNPSSDNSIVFSYDVGDTSNSYKGEPTVNYYGDIDTSAAIRSPLTEYNTSNWTANFSKPPLNIGRVYKHTSGALSSTWEGNSYGYTLKSYTYPAGAIYTLSAWVYVSPDCNISQLNVSIEGGGSWIDYNYQYDLNNKGTWQRIWLEINTLGGFAGNAIPIYPQRWGVTDGSFTGFYAWGGVMLEAKDHITQYTVGTRSATQGLLPLLGNTSINLSNVSFDSNAQIVFDGTDDYIVTTTSIPCNFGTGDFTIEVMIYPQSFISYTHMVALPDQNTFALKADIGNGIIYYYDPSFTTYGSTSGWTLTLNQWNHVVLVRSGNVAYAYLNGASKGSKTGFNTNLSSTQIVNIGNGGTLEHTPKKINLVKIYNTALTADQVQQNYRQYKSRFNLS
jgi:hypothetical protein